jgi:Tfp pilus assembly protein PilV
MTPRAKLHNPWRKRSANRRGISLIEVVAAATLGSLIVGLAVTALVLAIKNSDTAHHDLAARGELNRLARRFRRDVHAARQATFDAGPNLVTLSDGARQIRYRREGNTIERSEASNADGATANNQSPTREVFRLPPDYLSAIEVVPSGTANVLRLRVAPAPEMQSSTEVAQAAEILQNHAIDAWLGRDFQGAGVRISGTPRAADPSTAAADAATHPSAIANAQPAEVTP